MQTAEPHIFDLKRFPAYVKDCIKHPFFTESSGRGVVLPAKYAERLLQAHDRTVLQKSVALKIARVMKSLFRFGSVTNGLNPRKPNRDRFDSERPV